MTTRPDVAGHLRAALALAPGVVSAYLFGSAAEGRGNRESDVDVGVPVDRRVFPASVDRFEARLHLIGRLKAVVRRESISSSSTTPVQLVRRIREFDTCPRRAAAIIRPMRNMTLPIALILVVALAASGCRGATPPTPRQYELRGQILSVRPDIGEVQIKHEAIAGYMDAMTMSFGVKDRALLQGRAPGDLVRATLMVTDTDAWLSTIEKTGRAPLPAAEPETSAPAPVVDLLEPGQQVPDEGFVDQEGRPWRPSALAGKAYALTFIYTRCPLPTYCPLMNRNFRAAQQLVASRGALRDQVRFVTISFDPEFDTPAVLERFAKAIGADLGTWTLLTGERAALEAFAARFGVSVMREPDSPDTITHNLRTAVVGPAGTIAKIYSGNEWTPAQLVADLEAVAAR